MHEQTIIIADDHPLFRDALCQAVIGMDGHQDRSSRPAISRPRERRPATIPMPT
jgi:DNA-binding NarL/FixJ family response regulator